jgi:hypothetical protein
VVAILNTYNIQIRFRRFLAKVEIGKGIVKSYYVFLITHLTRLMILQPRYRRFPPKAVESHVIYRVATIGKKFNMADFSSNCFELKIYAD